MLTQPKIKSRMDFAEQEAINRLVAEFRMVLLQSKGYSEALTIAANAIRQAAELPRAYQPLDYSALIEPCPFCGKRPSSTPFGVCERGLRIECCTRDCAGPMVVDANPEVAIKTWNGRNKNAS